MVVNLEQVNESINSRVNKLSSMKRATDTVNCKAKAGECPAARQVAGHGEKARQTHVLPIPGTAFYGTALTNGRIRMILQYPGARAGSSDFSKSSNG
jgi:hypothetical protein